MGLSENRTSLFSLFSLFWFIGLNLFSHEWRMSEYPQILWFITIFTLNWPYI